MTGKATADKIIVSMAKMFDRGLVDFTNEQLATESGFHSKTIMMFTRNYMGVHIEKVSTGQAGRKGFISTYRWLESPCKRQSIANPLSRKAMAKKWAKLSVPPDIASLGKFRIIGNAYHYR